MTHASKWAKRGDCGAKGSDRAAFYVHRHIPGFLKAWLSKEHPLVLETSGIAVARGVGGRRHRRRGREADATAAAGMAQWQAALAVHDLAMATMLARSPVPRPSHNGWLRLHEQQRVAFERLPAVAQRRLLAMGHRGRAPAYIRTEMLRAIAARLRTDDGVATATDWGLLDVVAERALRNDPDILSHVLTVMSGAFAIGATSVELEAAMASKRGTVETDGAMLGITPLAAQGRTSP